MALILKQFSGSTVSPKDDAIMYDQMSSDYGIIKGCEVSKISTNIVSIASGYMLIHGRLIEVSDENINCELPSGNGNGRIYVQMDLQNTLEPVKILSVATTGTLPALRQDNDVNFNNSVFEMELATYTATATSIGTLRTTVPSVKGDFVKKSDIVNNLTSTSTDKPLSANMGKTLNSNISTLNTKVSNINVYVGTDKKLHFVDKDGADSALPFNSFVEETLNGIRFDLSAKETKTYTHTFDTNIIGFKNYSQTEQGSVTPTISFTDKTLSIKYVNGSSSGKNNAITITVIREA